MNEMETTPSAMDIIYRRHSVRSYAPGGLDRTAVEALLSAAVRAPTAIHQEPWAFVVVQDTALLKRLSDHGKALFLQEVHRTHLDRGGHALDVFEKPEFNIFYDAGTLIVICAPTSAPFTGADCWLAAENLMLAACEMGLGSCVIGSAVIGLNTPDTKAELGIPPEMSAVAPIIVGVPAARGSPTSRKPARILSWK